MVEQDIDGALANWHMAIRAAEQSAMTYVRGTMGQRRTFPELFTDPRYNQMLKDFNLDPVSIAKIHVPELPF
jgi:hypothetical protein